MADLEARSKRWVRDGLITSQQRTAILAAEGSQNGASEPPMPIVRRHGPAAEAFTLFAGLILAALAGGITFLAAEEFLVAFLIPGYILLAAGMAILFGFRNAALWADVSFMASVCMFGTAWIGVGPSEWWAVAMIAMPALITMVVIRLTRLVVAVSGAGAVYIYSVGGLPAANYWHLIIGFALVVVTGSAALLLLRQRIRALIDRRTNRSTRPLRGG